MKDPKNMAAPPRPQRLAQEARKLAMECLAGTAPEMGIHSEFYENGKPCCASGHVAARAGLTPKTPDYRNWDLRKFLRLDDREAWWVVANANDCAESHPDREQRLVFPLLALADALEDASKTPKETL